MARRILGRRGIHNVKFRACPVFCFYSKESAMIHRLLLFLLLVALFLPGDCLGQVTSDVMISVPYKGKEYIGQPLAWDGKEVALFRRDGRILSLIHI